MPFSRHYLDDLNFVLTHLAGPIDDQDVRDHIHALNREAAEGRALMELGDARGLSAGDLKRLTVSGILDAARMEEGQARVQGGKLAIVADDVLIYGFARAYTTVTSEYRGGARAFRDLAEALQWLELAEHAPRIEALIAQVEGRGTP